MNHIASIAPAALTVSLLLTACGDGTTAPDDLAPAASIAIESVGDTLLLQESRALRATIRDVEGRRLPDRTVTWSSSDPDVMAVSAGGTVSALRGGSAVITATSGAAADTVTIVARRLRFDRVYVGYDVACGLEASGEAWCWGATGVSSSFLRPEKPAASPVPHRSAAGSRFATLALGNGFACGIRIATDVVCWGANARGQLGDGSTSIRREPVPVIGVTNATALTAGGEHACAAVGGGTVRCWGANDWGQLGDGTYVDRPTPVQVVSLGAVTALAGGWAHTCAVSAGAPVCWGVDYRGELGHDTTYNRYVPARAGSVPGSSPAWSRIAAGGYQTCALDASGATYCWGTLESAHDFAELSYSPAAKAQGRQFIQIYDDAIQCGLEGDGELWCWDYRHEPVRFPGAGPIVDAAIAFSQVCALDAAGTVRCWDPISGGSIPGDVTGAPPLVSIAAASAQACGLSATGELWCWVPFGTIQGQATQARPATTGTTTQSFASVWDGSDRVCALTGTGDAWCSGGGFSPLPIAFTSFAAGFGFTTLASGEEHVCGLTATGAAWCWGSNDVGQVGDGTSTTRTTPVAVQGGHQFVEIAAGYAHTCARTGNGDAWCWGASGAGQIGDGTKWANPGPIGVTGATAAITVGSGGDFSCSLRPGGSAFCWPFLQPGSGDNVVAGPAPFVTLAVGGGHGCGLDAAGVASCWGSTSGGQLGDGRGGEGSSGPIPRPVLGGLHFASIASGLGGTTCGITLAGNTWCWGPNNTESLGSPDAAGTYASGIPVRVYGQE